MKPNKPRLTRPTSRRGAGQARLRGAVGSRDRSRPSGSTRPSLRAQLDAPIEPRRRTEPQTVRRAVVLGVLLALMLIVLTPALRSYLQQRSEIEQLKDDKTTAQKDVDSLEAQKKEWRNPAYVRRQATQRLGFGMPGQQITVYVDDSGKSHAVQNTTGVTDAAGLRDHPWYGQLWGSVTKSSNGTN